VSSNDDLLKQLQALIDDIRLEMRDYPELNRLMEDIENSDRMIALAIRNVVDTFNGIPPAIRSKFDWSTFPSRSLLITGVIGRLQRGQADLDTRNYYPASDGQVGIPSRQKGQMVERAAMAKWQEFKQDAGELKVSLNFREGLGGVGVASEVGMIVLSDYLRGGMTPLWSRDPYSR